MTTNFRNLINLRFTHAAALARAVDTLRSHDVFGGIEPTEDNAVDIGKSFLLQILSGKCPVVPQTIKDTTGIAHRASEIKFVEGEPACIEAFHTIIMDHSARITLKRKTDEFDLETNKDLNDLLWSEDRHTMIMLEGVPRHGTDCGCEVCEEFNDQTN